MLPAAREFITSMRGLFESPLDDDERWASAGALLSAFLRDPALKRHSDGWPDSPALLGLEGKHANLLFYEDPEHRFVINGLIKKPHAKTTVHDHGATWTLYGVVEGGEEIRRFARIDGGQAGDLPTRAEVRATHTEAVAPGYIDLIRPWEIHAEYNQSARTVAVIVRSQRPGTYVQNIFHPEDGSVEQYWGPRQITMPLSERAASD